MTICSLESNGRPLICTTCKVTKKVEEFGVLRTQRSLRGRQFKCLACSAAWHRAYYAKNKERFRSNNKARRQTWSPVRKKAYAAVAVAIKNGSLIRPATCESCEKRCRVTAHHEDYHRPLDVQWLCNSCHRQVHGIGLETKTFSQGIAS